MTEGPSRIIHSSTSPAVRHTAAPRTVPGPSGSVNKLASHHQHWSSHATPASVPANKRDTHSHISDRNPKLSLSLSGLPIHDSSLSRPYCSGLSLQRLVSYWMYKQHPLSSCAVYADRGSWHRRGALLGSPHAPVKPSITHRISHRGVFVCVCAHLC